MIRYRQVFVACVVGFLSLGCGSVLFAEDATWWVGFARVDATPTEPVRLSGFASRVESSQGVADPLYARAMVLAPTEKDLDHRSVVLVSVDSILVTSAITVEVAEWLDREYGIHRSQLVLSSTHSHAAPHIAGGLTNIYREPSTIEQTAATQTYTLQFIAAIKKSIQLAMQHRTPASLRMDQTEVRFAVNRRVLKDGVWSGFGVQADGSVDHRLRMMRAVAKDGKLIGAFFLYACHCTSMGADFNQVSGDWAGLAASRLESLHPQTVFLPIIGCGGDANPNPRGSYDNAQQHAAEIVDAISKMFSTSEGTRLEQFPVAHFGYAGLASELPTDAYMKQMEASDKPNERRWCDSMRRTLSEMGRLPESYPMPIHTWQFGDILTCVFLGGEVVIDYQYRIEKELPTAQTWVAAYSDDVFAYVASEKMRSENGYEVDFSMIYYMQPGRWQSGTQAAIIRRVREIFDNQGVEAPPLSVEESFKSIRVPDDYRVELVASEPLVQDPINIAFDCDGSIWVVEMGDYPLGSEGGGRIRKLWDTNGDGRLDESRVFLSGLSYPTSVHPWKNGVLVIAAPHIFFAQDLDGDHRADISEPLLTGLKEANPQHRANGFEIGLDGRLHLGLGSGTQAITSLKTGVVTPIPRATDIAWNPDTGSVELTSGDTQFVRSRDAFGNWFGNSNSQPMFQYVIESRYLPPNAPRMERLQHLLTPAVAPPVYPRSVSMDRFNDLHTFHRFTSACSSIISRVPGMGPRATNLGFLCEPVHNLMARIVLEPSGSTFRGRRHPDDQIYDFFTSADPWSRPVRVINAPDGTLWIVDMVRKVIEHPEWIPTSWQQRLDLRAGARMGRIYRVYHQDYLPQSDLAVDDHVEAIVEALLSENGALRDLGLLRALHHADNELSRSLRRECSRPQAPEVYVSLLGALAARNSLDPALLADALNHHDPCVVHFAIELAERLPLHGVLREAFAKIPERNLGPSVDLQWVLTSTKQPEFDTFDGFLAIAARAKQDPWVGQALSLVRSPVLASQLIRFYLHKPALLRDGSSENFSDRLNRIAPLWNQLSTTERRKLLDDYIVRDDAAIKSPDDTSKLLLFVLAARSRDSLAETPILREYATSLWSRLLDTQADEEHRIAIVGLIGSGCFPDQDELEAARNLLSNDSPPRLRQRVLETLRSLRSSEVPSILSEVWENFSSLERSVASTTLLARTDWCLEFLEDLESKKVAAESLDPATIQQLRFSPHRGIRSRAIALFGRPTPTSELVAQYLQQMPSPKESQMGLPLYREHCATCHEPKPQQPAIGPPLVNLKHWTLEQWLTAILDPNRNVEEKYRQTAVLTEDEQTYQGIVVEESDDVIRIMQSDSTLREIPSHAIIDRKASQLSLMPSGFEKKLSPQQLADIMAYLRQSHGEKAP